MLYFHPPVQLNSYIGECDEKLAAAQSRCESALAERDAALEERDKILSDHEGLAADHEVLTADHELVLSERDNVVVERDTMESDKWDIMKQLRDAEDRLVLVRGRVFVKFNHKL